MKKDIFKFENVDNFEKHINLSIPNYGGLVDIFTSFAYEYITPDGIFIDLGCSTGSFLVNLPKIEAFYMGVDIIDFIDPKYTKSFEDDKLIFIQSDILDFIDSYEYEVDVISLMFTLQFLGNKKRKEVIERLKTFVDNGTTLLISEKVYIDDSQINSILDRNHKVKKREHFTDTEILDKEYQLSGSMFCKSYKDIMKELTSIGKVTQVWQNYNFMGWVIQ